MKIFMPCIVIVAASALLVLGCAGTKGADTTIEAREGQDTAGLPEGKPGFKRIRYDGTPSFSLDVPQHFVEQEFAIPEWVIHVLGNPINDVARVVAAVFDVEDDEVLGGAPDRYIDHMEELYPGTSNYHVEDKKTVTLNDGTQALRYDVYYMWTDGFTAIRAAILTIFMDGTGIQVTASCHVTPIEDLGMLVDSFRFE